MLKVSNLTTSFLLCGGTDCRMNDDESLLDCAYCKQDFGPPAISFTMSHSALSMNSLRQNFLQYTKVFGKDSEATLEIPSLYCISLAITTLVCLNYSECQSCCLASQLACCNLCTNISHHLWPVFVQSVKSMPIFILKHGRLYSIVKVLQFQLSWYFKGYSTENICFKMSTMLAYVALCHKCKWLTMLASKQYIQPYFGKYNCWRHPTERFIFVSGENGL